MEIEKCSDKAFLLIGHKARCFDLRCLQPFGLILSSSEEGCAILWKLSTKQKLFKFSHDKSEEVLRSTFLDDEARSIATCGSIGCVRVWRKRENLSSSQWDYFCSSTLTHLDHQIYSCEIMSNISFVTGACLVTSSCSKIYLWALDRVADDQLIKISEISPYFETIQEPTGRPDDGLDIFDAQPSPVERGMLAIGISDGTFCKLDVENDREVFRISLLEGDSGGSHVTAIHYHNTINITIVALRSGAVKIIDMREVQHTVHDVTNNMTHSVSCVVFSLNYPYREQCCIATRFMIWLVMELYSTIDLVSQDRLL